MGVKITSLAQIPSGLEAPYFVYLLTSNYPYRVNLGLRRSFEIFAKQAGQDFVAFEGLIGEFGGEVMNAYSIAGIPADEMLPAILISTVNPHRFLEAHSIDTLGPFEEGEKVVLVSLRDAYKSEDDLFDLARSLIQDMKQHKPLLNFAVNQTKRTQFVDSLVLEPNLAGFVVDLKTMWSFLRDNFAPNKRMQPTSRVRRSRPKGAR